MVIPDVQDIQLFEEEEEGEVHGLPLEVLSEFLVPATELRVEPAPTRILLGTLGDGRLRVRSPFLVTLTQENQDYIAEVEDLSEFGFGKNPTEAIADVRRAIAELYFTLEQEQERLGPDLVTVWDTLRGKLEKVEKAV